MLDWRRSLGVPRGLARPVIVFAAAAELFLPVLAATAPLAAAPLPDIVRSISLEKTAAGYRWTLTRSPMPALGEHQVLVHVRAVSLNRDDLSLLAPNPHADLTGIKLGSDAAGDVVALGKAVTDLQVGERVTNTYFRDWQQGTPSRKQLDPALRATVAGVAADYVALDDTGVIPMPKGYSYAEAATLPTAGLTAWVATVGRNRLGPSKVVVIEGTGGVSTFAMQFAAATGARIILTSSSDEKLQRTLGIARHESINYRSVPSWSERVMALTAGRGADLVVDVGGKRTLGEAAQSLAPGGTLSVVGGLTGYDGDIPAGILLEKVAKAQGVFVGSRADFRRMIAFIEAHRLQPVIDRVFPLNDYQRALSLLQSDRFIGKIVLRFDDAPAAAAE
ncbi:MAG TPA: NAD(P)-dependent alcohol dehydrogenase [Steroidobacteraceae bacterium]|nr:NAD(P)-dependent alcohol dehydrogenase [Steroidobacteraceae bacterium]